jgi:WD40 repeat protein
LGTVVLWDITSGEAVLKLEVRSVPVVDVGWSRDGKRLAALDKVGTAWIWDASAGYSR